MCQHDKPLHYCQSSERNDLSNTPKTSTNCSRNTSSDTTYTPMTCSGCQAAPSIRSGDRTLSRCFTDVNTWCTAKRLQLNSSKTEVMSFGTTAGLRKLPSGSERYSDCPEVVKPASVIRYLGV